ncbi:MAG: GIY-YIG nuclease family protein [Bacteroidetes bacterium]|nr:GIY-YIG nuclease family protein [Bacteroidota bacterium]
MQRGGFIYILTNRSNDVLYTGVTSRIKERVLEHRMKKYPRSFTARYKVHKLVYYEFCHTIEEAIAREKQLKAGSRQKKIDLIISTNPNWNDLFDAIDELY